jgi:transposase-like protein
MAKKRRTYTPEFKTEAVKLVTEQGYSVACVSIVGSWRGTESA